MKSRAPTLKEVALFATGVVSVIGLSIGGHVIDSLGHLHVSEILIVLWFTFTAPVVLVFTFHDDISGRSFVLLGGIALALSALSSKISRQYGSSTLENLAIITSNYILCELLGLLFVYPSKCSCDSVIIFFGILIVISASKFSTLLLSVNWQDEFRCAYHLSFTALLYFSIPSLPPLGKETIKEPRLRLWYNAAGFVGVQLVTFGWLQFRSSFKSFIFMPSNPWYTLIASLVFIGLNFIWLLPVKRTVERVVKENRRILTLRELAT